MLPTNEAFVIPPKKFVLVSSGAVSSTQTLAEGCRGLHIGTAGTLNGTMTDGTTFTGLPVLQGTIPGFFATITGGTAQNIWAIY